MKNHLKQKLGLGALVLSLAGGGCAYTANQKTLDQPVAVQQKETAEEAKQVLDETVQKLIEEQFELTPEGYTSASGIYGGSMRSILAKTATDKGVATLVLDYDKLEIFFYNQKEGKTISTSEDTNMNGIPESIQEVFYDEQGRISQIKVYEGEINLNTGNLKDIKTEETLKPRRVLDVKYDEGKVSLEGFWDLPEYTLDRLNNKIVSEQRKELSVDGRGRITEIKEIDKGGVMKLSEVSHFSYTNGREQNTFFLGKNDPHQTIRWDAQGNKIEQEGLGLIDVWKRDEAGNTLTYTRAKTYTSGSRREDKMEIEYERGVPIQIHIGDKESLQFVLENEILKLKK